MFSTFLFNILFLFLKIFPYLYLFILTFFQPLCYNTFAFVDATINIIMKKRRGQLLFLKLNILPKRGVAQLVARMVRDHEARSSSLRTPTKIKTYSLWVRFYFVNVRL